MTKTWQRNYKLQHNEISAFSGCLGEHFFGRLFSVDLIKWVSNARPYVHKTFLQFQWNFACRYR